jgi:hypothetical protein
MDGDPETGSIYWSYRDPVGNRPAVRRRDPDTGSWSVVAQCIGTSNYVWDICVLDDDNFLAAYGNTNRLIHKDEDGYHTYGSGEDYAAVTECVGIVGTRYRSSSGLLQPPFGTLTDLDYNLQ